MNGNKPVIWIFLMMLIIISAFVSGCMGEASISQDTQTADRTETVTITDMAGRTVEVPENVERVVAVGAGTLRQIAYFDAMDKVVGVESGEKENPDNAYRIIYFDKMADLPEVGPTHGGNPELIAGVRPEVIIFGNSGGDAGDAINYQRKTGIPVLFVDRGDLADGERETLYKEWELYGKILGKPERAQELQEYTEYLIADLNSRTENIPDNERPIAFPGGLSHRGGHGLLSTQYPYASFDMINAKNAFNEEDVDSRAIQSVAFAISPENLLSWDPDIIFVDVGNLDLIRSDIERNPSYKDIKAFRDDNVHGVLSVSAYARNHETVIINSYYMGSILYPKRFNDIDFEEKADDIYMMFLGEPVYERMVDKFGGYSSISF